MSRYHLVMEALHRSRRVPAGADDLIRFCHDQLQRHHDYVREFFEDMPEIRTWRWPGPAATH
jgi:xylulose-5-phosphate/fructose-6-phosphate phosphoketolase